MLNPDYRDLLSAFANSRVEFVLVGAYAMAAHGQPRATMDIDLLVRPTAENVARMVAALREFGAPEGSIDAQALGTPGMVVQIGVAPRRVDLLTRLTGVATDAAFAHALPVEIEGLRIPVLALGDLIANKRATGRAQDRLDADRLEGLQRPD
ncbi:MAG: nucleotidyltransferase [Xanthomonadales bacterium]|nr:nucleotidyltransferase [Xanthomonadales bacterium]